MRKHKVSFNEAVEVFADRHALLSYDVDHEDDEDRWHIIGQSQKMRTLFVVFCERIQKDGLTVYRIISARKAERGEAQEYEDGH